MGISHVQSVTSSLNSVQASLSSVPNLASYTWSLTPAVTAYDGLGPTLLTDAKNQISSINNSITTVSFLDGAFRSKSHLHVLLTICFFLCVQSMISAPYADMCDSLRRLSAWLAICLPLSQGGCMFLHHQGSSEVALLHPWSVKGLSVGCLCSL